MPVRTPEELTDYLDRELSWRKHELTTINLQLQGADDRVQVVMIRSGLCLLYAHWEGFITAAARRYLEYVANRRLKYRDLKRNFLVNDLLHQVRGIAKRREVDLATDLVDKVLNGERRFTSRSIELIDTRSNLGSKVFMDLLNLVGIDQSKYHTKEKLLNARLVHNRNNIAHGGRSHMESDDYIDLHDTIVALMDQFREDLELAASTGSYRAQ